MTDPSQTLRAARAYQARGLRVFPLNGKVPITTNGVDDATLDDELIEKWFSKPANIGIAVPHGFVVVDVDPRNDGDKTWQTWLAEHGHEWLADVPRAHTGRGDGGMHWWFQFSGVKLRKAFGGIDFVAGNKYVVAPPSKTVHSYRWDVALPQDLDDVPHLPDWLFAIAERPEPAFLDPGTTVAAQLVRADNELGIAAEKYTTWSNLLLRHGWHLVSGDGNSDGSKWRHPSTDNQFSATIRYNNLFVFSPNTPFPVTEEGDTHGVTIYNGILELDFNGDQHRMLQAFRDAGYLPERAQSIDLTELVPASVIAKRAAEAAASIRTEGSPEPERTLIPENEEDEVDTVLVPGGVFIWDGDADIAVRWGRDTEVLWAQGESVMICGPPGVGKTTLAHQLVAALLGIQDEVLEMGVMPAKRVLYLAMDRPRQIRRAMRRLFKEKDRETLDERLLVRRGPLPADLAKNSNMLVDMALENDCDVIVVDSLKDAAIKLSDDETGGGVNRAIQWCNAEDIDVCVLHHQRKGSADNSKPTKLDDVYGSAWLTAGTGSVVLLWGEAGSELVELIHLKQPLDPVGPLSLQHNHHEGTTQVLEVFDLLACLKNNQGTTGCTLAKLAQLQSGKTDLDAKSKEMQSIGRKVRAAVKKGTVREADSDAKGGQFVAKRYFLVSEFASMVGSVTPLHVVKSAPSTVDNTVDKAF